MNFTECGFRTFQWNINTTAPQILIAVDDLLLDSDNLDATKAKVTELFTTHQGLANEGSVHLTLFSTKWAQVRTTQHVDQILEQDLIGKCKDRWRHLFAKINEVYRNYSQPAKVFILSDMNDSRKTLENQFKNLEQHPPSALLKLHFCQFGDALTSYFYNSANSNTLLGIVIISHERIKY